MKTIIFITYDSIFNSVFSSQVVKPLQKWAFNNHKISIVSFEKKVPSLQQINRLIPAEFSFFCLKKFPFFGHLSLLPALLQLKKVLSPLNSYSLIARGPLAGYLALKAHTPQCLDITIQARGLLAHEYLYVHQHDSFIKKNLLYIPRFYLYKSLEQTVYGNSSAFSAPYSIEAVSNALKQFLITEYKADAHRIALAQNDTPPHFSTEQINAWRQETRAALNISPQRKVYCYNGSLHPWQCPEQTIDFFRAEFTKDPRCFLLILTHDVANFDRYIKQSGIDSTNYHITFVEHNALYRFLAAADYGLIFRESHIINWVSRPTKVLEYRAVNLPIIHNNTIEYVSSL